MKQKRILGAVLSISLGNSKIAYARVVKDASYAIYDLISDTLLAIDEVVKHEILFIVAVYDDVVISGRWKIIGQMKLEDNLLKLPLKFIQDELDPNKFELYDPNTGDIRNAKREECLGLERAAVWEAEHVEERIMDNYMGKTNVWVEQLSLK